MCIGYALEVYGCQINYFAIYTLEIGYPKQFEFAV